MDRDREEKSEGEERTESRRTSSFFFKRSTALLKMTVGELGEKSSVDTEMAMMKKRAPPKATTAKFPVLAEARATGKERKEGRKGRSARSVLLRLLISTARPPSESQLPQDSPRREMNHTRELSGLDGSEKPWKKSSRRFGRKESSKLTFPSSRQLPPLRSLLPSPPEHDRLIQVLRSHRERSSMILRSESIAGGVARRVVGKRRSSSKGRTGSKSRSRRYRRIGAEG